MQTRILSPLVAILALSGCLGGAGEGGVVAVEIKAIEADAGNYVRLRLRNEGGISLTVSYLGFRLIDAEGLTAKADHASTNAWTDEAFPMRLRVDPGGSAVGWVGFGLNYEGVPPFTIAYEHGLARGRCHFGENATAPLCV